MKPLRPWLHAVLGLALLVQGVAWASAPVASAPPAPVEQAAAVDEMPCHGAAQAPAPESAATATAPCACCDGGCVDMSGCAFGHLAAVAAAYRVHLAPVHDAAIATPDRVPASVSLPSLLRPPISFHA